MNVQEVSEKLLEASDGYWGEWEYGRSYALIDGLGEVWVVGESKRGEEGGGEEIYLIFKIHHLTNEEEWLRYFRVDGYYGSYDGSEWDGDLYEVVPRQRMITVYEKPDEQA